MQSLEPQRFSAVAGCSKAAHFAEVARDFLNESAAFHRPLRLDVRTLSQGAQAIQTQAARALGRQCSLLRRRSTARWLFAVISCHFVCPDRILIWSTALGDARRGSFPAGIFSGGDLSLSEKGSPPRRGSFFRPRSRQPKNPPLGLPPRLSHRRTAAVSWATKNPRFERGLRWVGKGMLGSVGL